MVVGIHRKYRGIAQGEAQCLGEGRFPGARPTRDTNEAGMRGREGLRVRCRGCLGHSDSSERLSSLFVVQ